MQCSAAQHPYTFDQYRIICFVTETDVVCVCLCVIYPQSLRDSDTAGNRIHRLLIGSRSEVSPAKIRRWQLRCHTALKVKAVFFPDAYNILYVIQFLIQVKPWKSCTKICNPYSKAIHWHPLWSAVSAVQALWPSTAAWLQYITVASMTAWQ